MQYAGPRCSACFDVINLDPENGFSGKWINDGNKQFHEECYKKKIFVEMRAKHSQFLQPAVKSFDYGSKCDSDIPRNVMFLRKCTKYNHGRIRLKALQLPQYQVRNSPY